MKGEADKRTEENEVKENKQVDGGATGGGAAPPQSTAPVHTPSEASGGATSGATTGGGGRKPFTQLSQMESDMALARALQDQERAYMILRANTNQNYYGVNMESDEDDDVEDDPEGDDPELPLGQLESDEAFARALQEAEVQESTARMMALAGIQIHDLDEDDENRDEDEDDVVVEDDEDEDVGEQDDDEDEEVDGSDSEEMWEDVDPDNMTYEELIALGEVVGSESRGLAATSIAELPVTKYSKNKSSSDNEQCVICRHEYEEAELLLTLPCKHNYHSECIQQWLQINKICPVCTAEVGGSSSS